MKITLVKKINKDGNFCRKCVNVVEKLEKKGLMGRIDQIVVADEREPSSEGLDLAIKHGVEAAPFFIVDHEDGSTQGYSTSVRFFKEILNQKTSEREEVSEIMDRYPELDFI